MDKRHYNNFSVMDVSENKNFDDNIDNSSALNRVSSLSFSVGEITDTPIPQTSAHYSVTAVLNYCKNKILKPYLRLLSIAGLRPLALRTQDSVTCLELLSHFYIIIIIGFMGCGYVLQYMACFRRDRGFGYRVLPDNNVGIQGPYGYMKKSFASRQLDYEQICHGSLFFSYVIPSLMHLVGYMYAVYVFRSADDDQLPSLMERVFLSLSNLSDGFLSQKRLIKTLWLFVTIGLIWMAFSFISVNLLMNEAAIDFKWINNSFTKLIILLKILLIICTLWHDLIQATVISNYCLQAQLLTSYIEFLHAKILQYPIHPTDWMRDIGEFRKLLNYFNQQLSPAVCILTITNIACSISGTLWLLDFDHIDKEAIPAMILSVLNVALWILITLAPFIQAARLTKSCEKLRLVGHEVRLRPFCHQTTPSYKLDSILLFTSSLKLSAKMYGLPITGRFLQTALIIGFLTILILGQLHYLRLN